MEKNKLVKIELLSENINNKIKKWSSYNLLSELEKNFLKEGLVKLGIKIVNLTASEKLDEKLDYYYNYIEKFEYYPLQMYPELFTDSLIKYLEFLPDNITTIYVLPGALPSNNYSKEKKDNYAQNVKSYHILLYMFKSNLISAILEKSKRVNLKFKIQSDFDILNNSLLELNNNASVLLVDDFVGSGNSLTLAKKYWIKNDVLTNGNVNVLTLSIEASTLDEYSKEGFNFFYSKSIPHFSYNSSNVTNNYLFSKIFKYTKNQKKQRQDNILLSMIRTPNNTYPMFYTNSPFERGK